MKILVTLDGSEFAEQVLKTASELAASSGSEVHLIRIIRPHDVHGTSVRLPYEERGVSVEGMVAGRERPAVVGETRDQAIQRLLAEGKDYLRSISSQFFSGEVIEYVSFGQDPVKEILEYAQSNEIDLVFTATHGRSGLTRTMMGSVASGLVRAGVVPICLYRPGAKPAKEN